MKGCRIGITGVYIWVGNCEMVGCRGIGRQIGRFRDVELGGGTVLNWKVQVCNIVRPIGRSKGTNWEDQGERNGRYKGSELGEARMQYGQGN